MLHSVINLTLRQTEDPYRVGIWSGATLLAIVHIDELPLTAHDHNALFKKDRALTATLVVNGEGE